VATSTLPAPLAVALSLLVTAVGCSQPRVPELARRPSAVSVFALDPERPDEHNPLDNGPSPSELGGYRALKRVEISDPEERYQIGYELSLALLGGPPPAKCFNPRHGVRVIAASGAIVDVVICFECNQARIGEATRRIHPSFVRTLDRALSARVD